MPIYFKPDLLLGESTSSEGVALVKKLSQTGPFVAPRATANASTANEGGNDVDMALEIGDPSVPS